MPAKDKRPNPSGWGTIFEHTNPQRRMPCALGDLLVPASADDIAPIPEASLQAVEAAMELLAEHITDRDFLLSGGFDARVVPVSERATGLKGTSVDRAYEEAKAIRRVKRALRGILRIEPSVRDRLCIVSYSEVRPGEPYMAFSVAGLGSAFCQDANIAKFQRSAITTPITTHEHAGKEIVVLRADASTEEPSNDLDDAMEAYRNAEDALKQAKERLDAAVQPHIPEAESLEPAAKRAKLEWLVAELPSHYPNVRRIIEAIIRLEDAS